MQLSIKECHKDWLNKLPFLASIYNDTLSKDLNLKIDDPITILRQIGEN